MSFGTIFQLVGAGLGLIWALVTKQYVIAGLFGLHLTGDAILGFLKPLDFVANLEKDALKFVKLRGFLFFVGWALMVVGHFTHIDTRLLFFAVTSNGLFILGAMVAIVGAFTYPDMYT